MAGGFVQLHDGRVAYISVFREMGRSDPPDVAPKVLPQPKVPPPPPEPIPTTIELPPDIFLVVPPGRRLSGPEVSGLRMTCDLVIEVDLSRFSSAPLLDIGKLAERLEPEIPDEKGLYRFSLDPSWSGSDLRGLGLREVALEEDA